MDLSTCLSTIRAWLRPGGRSWCGSLEKSRIVPRGATGERTGRLTGGGPRKAVDCGRCRAQREDASARAGGLARLRSASVESEAGRPLVRAAYVFTFLTGA